MPESLPHVISSWIKFLRHYGPIPKNDNMYDEHIQKSIKRCKVEPIRIEPKYLEELVQNFRSESPRSVILTGTAGDGKTYYCREIWLKLGGSAAEWQKAERIKTLPLHQANLVIIKDLTEVGAEEKKAHLHAMSEAIINGSKKSVYLMAANDGQLLDALLAVNDSESILKARREIENLLVSDRQASHKYRLDLYNLSRTDSAELFPRILRSILEHAGWSECNGCVYQQGKEREKRCPIWENKTRLENSLFQQRLTDLLELCELNGFHLPIRQMLLLVANALLGHPDMKDDLMGCKDVSAILNDEKSALASPYRNVFGRNLSDRKRESQDVFRFLGRFGIGTETNNLIDNTLIFGEDDPDLKEHYDELIRADEYYGADSMYRTKQKAYLEGELTDGGEAFLSLLESQRQRLFFTVPPDVASEIKLWELTTFHFAGEYLDDVYRTLSDGKQVSNKILSRLVRGLNRIFIGLLANNQTEIILATSGNHSQARVCRVFEEFISVTMKRGERVYLSAEAELKQPILVVAVSAQLQAKLALNLTRYEYLSRIAEGSLPNSFSRECYEDILAFKTRVLTQLNIRRQEEGELSEGGDLSIRLIPELEADGLVKSPPVLEIRI